MTVLIIQHTENQKSERKGIAKTDSERRQEMI